MEWHCKHYVGRGLMKRIEGGDALAKEFGVSGDAVKKTFATYNAIVRAKKDPFGKTVNTVLSSIFFEFTLPISCSKENGFTTTPTMLQL